MMKKLEFNDQVCNQQLKDLNERNNTATATIMALETKVRELIKSDSSISEMLKQVREVAENELNRYKMESEAQQFRDVRYVRIRNITHLLVWSFIITFQFV